MAHATLHFAVGFLVGTAFALPGLLRRLRRGGRLSPGFAYWILLSYGLGVWAVMPHLLYRVGAPFGLREQLWANLFVGYPLIHRFGWGGVFLGTAACTALIAGQYTCLLIAVACASRREQAATGE